MFDKNFIWGCASSAYQIEGAAYEGGRGESVWDVFAHTPGKIHEGHNGDVACDFTEDFLSALDASGTPWCCWGDHYSPLIHQQMPERRFMFNGEQWLREDHTYENVTKNFIADTELMEVYKKYIKYRNCGPGRDHGT